MSQPALPTLASGSLCYYNSTFAYGAKTDLVQFFNGSEQRWRARTGLVSFTLLYTDVQSYDVNVLLDFFVSKKGRFLDAALTNCFTVTVTDASGNSNTYGNCMFDQDDFTERESKPGRYAFTLKVRQAVPD